MQLGREYTNIRYTGDGLNTSTLTSSTSGLGSTHSLMNRSSLGSITSLPFNSTISTPVLMRTDSKKCVRANSEVQLPR